MIIDCHCHAGMGDGLTGPWDTRAPLEKYLHRAAQAGIYRTVLLAAFHSDYAVANREVARIAASRPERFYGFAFVHPVRDRGRVQAMVKVAVKRYGYLRCPPLRFARTSGRTGRTAQDPLRLRWALAAPGGRAYQDTCVGVAARTRTTHIGEEFSKADRPGRNTGRASPIQCRPESPPSSSTSIRRGKRIPRSLDKRACSTMLMLNL
jgi:hypothetical protein